jgi:hypothetical protein
VPTMHIDDPMVERVARTLSTTRAEGDSDSARSAERLLREQPEVLAFVLAGTAKLGLEARSVGVFLGDVIFETFRRAGRTAQPLSTTQFVAALKQNREMACRVGQAHDKIAERYLRNSKTLRQPALIRYVTGVLLESEPTCPHTVPRDELGPLFIMLKSIIDVLDGDEAVAETPAS